MIYPLISAEYIKTFGDHNLKVLMLAEKTTRKYSMFSATRRDLFTTSIPELFIGSENEQTNNGSSGPDIGRKSAVARINFFVDLSYRQDIRERPSKTALSNIWIDLSTAQPIYPTTLSDNTKVPDPSVSSVSYSGSTTGNRNPIARSDRSIFGTYDRLDNTFRGKIGFKYKVPGVDGLTLGTDINLTLLDLSLIHI